MATLRPDKPQHAYVIGKGVAIELGSLPPEKANEIINMSPSAQQQEINKLVESTPEAMRNCAGFCTKNKAHMTLLECIRCARSENMTKTQEWEACKAYYLTKP